jgi:heptaprenyl diphosphate synthase
MNNFWKKESSVQEFLVRTNEVVRAAVSPASVYIRSTLIDLAENRGKMLRPAMIFIASLLGEEQDRDESLILNLSAAMEMLHMASLVHDDVIDDSSTRRGRPTIQAQAGVKKAVIAGDYLLTRAFSQLSAGNDEMSPEIVKNSICRLCDSEIDQDSELWDFSIGESRYLRRIAGKTASLFSLSLYLGGAAVKAPERTRQLLRKIGYEIGMFFQIQDDILDYTGDAADLGKPSGNDLRCGLATLPLIYALQNDSSRKLEKLLENRRRINRRVSGRIIQAVTDLGGLTRAAEKSHLYCERAYADIARLGANEASRLLLTIMDRLDKRKS